MLSKITSFFDVQIVACDVVIKQFLQPNLTFTTLYATIAWLENGVSLRVVYTSDINTSKSGKTKHKHTQKYGKKEHTHYWTNTREAKRTRLLFL